MVVLITPAEQNGGILQFSIQMLQSFCSIGVETVLYVPAELDKEYYRHSADAVRVYHKTKSVRPNHPDIKALAEEIIRQAPEVLLCLEDSVLMWQLAYLLRKSSVKTCMVIHDITQHPYQNIPLRKLVVEWLRVFWSKKALSYISRAVLLSQNSFRMFRTRYPRYADRAVEFTLGAHIPEAQPALPPELMEHQGKYFLFFGRIDKYKGIANLLKAYQQAGKGRGLPLVIAGKGTLTEEEKTAISADSNICLSNRFISDGEMIWLFQNAHAIVLPYIEASQSGILPISYQFEAPVICTNLDGLTEFVEDGKTGFIGGTVEQFAQAMERMADTQTHDTMLPYIREYCRAHFSWAENCRDLLEKINV